MTQLSDLYQQQALSGVRPQAYNRWNISSAESTRPLGMSLGTHVNALNKGRDEQLQTIYATASQLKQKELETQVLKQKLQQDQQKFETDEQIRKSELQRNEAMDERNLKEKDIMLREQQAKSNETIKDIQRGAGAKDLKTKIEEGRLTGELGNLDLEIESNRRMLETSSLEKDYLKAVNEFQLKNFPNSQRSIELQQELEMAQQENDLVRAKNALSQVGNDITVENMSAELKRDLTKAEIAKINKLTELRTKVAERKQLSNMQYTIQNIVRNIPILKNSVMDIKNDPYLVSSDVNVRVQAAKQHLAKAGVTPSMQNIQLVFGSDFTEGLVDSSPVINDAFNQIGTALENVE